jgi:hypothetical protein
MANDETLKAAMRDYLDTTGNNMDTLFDVVMGVLSEGSGRGGAEKYFMHENPEGRIVITLIEPAHIEIDGTGVPWPYDEEREAERREYTRRQRKTGVRVRKFFKLTAARIRNRFAPMPF